MKPEDNEKTKILLLPNKFIQKKKNVLTQFSSVFLTQSLNDLPKNPWKA